MSIAMSSNQPESGPRNHGDSHYAEGSNAGQCAAADAASGTSGNASGNAAYAAGNAAGNASDAGKETPLSEESLRQLQLICERFGAPPESSALMARQLVKRAGQLAVQRGQSEAAALQYLLSLMVEASKQGDEPQSPL